MKIRHAEYVISAVKPEQCPDEGLTEIGLIGRSNVGKSSLINRLLLRKNLARTSSVPGKTQTLNYYKIQCMPEDQEEDAVFHLVDLPGYGYAKVSQTTRQQWGTMIERYLLEREPLKLILLLVDMRHPPTKDDQAIFEWLLHHNLPLCVVATKADKIPRSKWQKHYKAVKETLDVPSHVPVIQFSSETGYGRDDLWQILMSKIG